MKSSVVIKIALVLAAMNGVVMAQGPNQFVREISVTDSVAAPPRIAESHRHFVIVEIAGFPFRAHESGWWQPDLALRAGYRQNFRGPFDVCAFIEYTEFNFDAHGGLSSYVFSHGSRRDYAIYAASVALGFIEIAFGGCYTIQDEIIHTSGYLSSQTVDPVVKKLRLYYHFGVTSTIHIVGPVDIPLGLFFRPPDELDKTFPGIRAGIRVDF
jgi:hypothetical protein